MPWNTAIYGMAEKKTSKTEAKAKATPKKSKRNATSFNSKTAKEANKKSRESARRNRSLREWAKFYGKQHIKLKNPQGKEEDATWDGAIVVGLYRKAMSGDTSAAKLLADLTGQSPAQQIEVSGTAKVKHEHDMTPAEAAEFIKELKTKI